MDNPLLSPSPGLMIWTFITFGLAMLILKKYAFGPIQKSLDERRELITNMVENAERAREEADAMLKEYRSQLNSAKGEADAIVERARKAGDELTARVKAEGEAQRQEQLAQTQQQITAEVERAMSELRSSVADMTLTAAERVLRGSIDASQHEKLIEQAVNELDFDRLQKVGAGS